MQLLEYLSRTPLVGMWLYLLICLNGSEESCLSLLIDGRVFLYAFFMVIP
jgi:hypothetical protein